MIVTNEKLENISDKVCDLVYTQVDEYNNIHHTTFAIEPCEICPFTQYCAEGQTGFKKFFEQEVNK